MSKIKGTLETPDFLFIGQDNFIAVDKVQDAATNGVYHTAATTFMEVLNSNTTHVAGSTSSLSFQAGTNGRFEGTLPDTLSLTEGSTYYVHLTITRETNVGLWRKQLKAAYRTAS